MMLVATNYAPDVQFEIRRVGDVVSYWYGGALVYTSRVRSTGELSVGSALYATDDMVP